MSILKGTFGGTNFVLDFERPSTLFCSSCAWAILACSVASFFLYLRSSYALNLQTETMKVLSLKYICTSESFFSMGLSPARILWIYSMRPQYELSRRSRRWILSSWSSFLSVDSIAAWLMIRLFSVTSMA